MPLITVEGRAVRHHAADAQAPADAHATAAGDASVTLVHMLEESLRPCLGHLAGEARDGVTGAADTSDLSLNPGQNTVASVVTADVEVK